MSADNAIFVVEVPREADRTKYRVVHGSASLFAELWVDITNWVETQTPDVDRMKRFLEDATGFTNLADARRAAREMLTDFVEGTGMYVEYGVQVVRIDSGPWSKPRHHFE